MANESNSSQFYDDVEQKEEKVKPELKLIIKPAVARDPPDSAEGFRYREDVEDDETIAADESLMDLIKRKKKLPTKKNIEEVNKRRNKELLGGVKMSRRMEDSKKKEEGGKTDGKREDGSETADKKENGGKSTADEKKHRGKRLRESKSRNKEEMEESRKKKMKSNTSGSFSFV